MSPSSKNGILFSLNFIVWILNALALTGTITLFAKKGIPITIETIPARTRLSINGSVWISKETTNGWIQSPAKINLPPGQHKITLERQGYAPHSFKVLLNDKDGEMTLNTELEALPESTNEIEIITSEEESQSITVILDQGLEIASPPMIAKDLLPGLHSLEIKSNHTGETKIKPYICSFTLPTPDGSPFRIEISKKNNRLHAQGCQKIKRIP